MHPDRPRVKQRGGLRLVNSKLNNPVETWQYRFRRPFMAHIELGYRASAIRPSAPHIPSRARETAQAQRPARVRPKFCRIDGGQLVRAAFLVLLCVGLSQLPRAERLAPSGSVAALQSRV